jgi:hypothetical protein
MDYERTKHPNAPIHYLVPDEPLEGSANELTKTIIRFLLKSGHFAERISNQGQFRDESKEVTNILGHTYKIGSGRWTKGQGTNGTADISVTLKGGGALKIEIKYGKDRQSEDQKVYQANVEQAQGRYWIVRDLDSFITQYDKLMEELTMEEVDKMLIGMKRAAVGTYNLTPAKLKVLKAGWAELREFDPAHEYTISEDGSKVRKEVRPLSE